jgi:hypothetical protein
VVYRTLLTNFIGLSSLSGIRLQSTDPVKPESLNSSISSSSSTPQQISSPAVSLLLNESTESHNSRSSRTVVPPCNATTPQGQLTVKATTPRPNGSVLTDLNGCLRDLPESPSETNFTRQMQQTILDDGQFTPEYIQISNQVTPTGNVNRTPHSSAPNKGAPLKPEQDTGESEYRLQQSFTYGRPEDADLPSTSTTTSHSLSKDSSFPPARSSLTSWSSKDDPFDPTKLHVGSSPSSGTSQRFRFSTTSSNSQPPPDSHISSSRKSSIALQRESSRQHNRHRPHIHEKVVSIRVINRSMLFSLSPA